MIVFDCPHCGEEMEVADTKAGMHVHCVECGEYVEVLERLPSGKKRKRIRKDVRQPDYLRHWEYWTYGAIFFFTPCISLAIAGVLYIFWQEKYPNKSFQINQLAWGVFALHMFAGAGCIGLSCILGGRRGGRPR